jgi:glycosyltransferase involved in cell wall biosynthesis
VVPGYPTPHERELRALAAELGIADRVRLPGWLPPEDLEGLYAAASCVVFPSLYEGFGLPVLEAMARGVPVACSNRSSLPEVAGDAALLFDPEDVDAIRAAVERLLGDAELRARLSEAGRGRADGFTWRRTAELTAASYERALAGGN